MNNIKLGGILLLVLDVIGAFICFDVVHFLRMDYWLSSFSNERWILIVAAVLCLYIMDAYTIRPSRPTWKFVTDSLAAIFGVGLTSIALIYLIGISQFTPIFGRGILPLAILLFALWALGFRWIISEWLLKRLGIIHWLVISDRVAYEDLERNNEESVKGLTLEHLESGADAEQLKLWLEDHPKQAGIVFQDYFKSSPEMMDVLRSAGSRGLFIISLTEFFEQYWQKLPISSLHGEWLAGSIGTNLLSDPMGVRFKRVIDLVFGILTLTVLAPLLLVVALVVRLSSPGRIFYKQERVGLGGKVFTLYKFRSMVQDAERVGPQWSEINDPRVTTVGRFLRASRMDELPQLWNLIVGNMSLIGPRPERPEFVNELKKEIPFYEIRELVVPGLSGWAQVKYPYGSSVKDSYRKLEYDLFYIKNHSVRLDITIFFKTCLVVLKGSGR
jgi:exopolysaccharide biosynthesis polyprenyl glycosylphosphotransferase